LVVISVLSSAISAYYYLRVLVFMYMKDPSGEDRQPNRRLSALAVVSVAAMVLATMQIGLAPAKWISAAKQAVASL
jgi:NADH-quinone oxidoreductase subunit N